MSPGCGVPLNRLFPILGDRIPRLADCPQGELRPRALVRDLPVSLRAQPPCRLGVPVGPVPTARLARDWPDRATGSCPTCSRQPDKLGQDLPSPRHGMGLVPWGTARTRATCAVGQGAPYSAGVPHTVQVSRHVRLSSAARGSSVDTVLVGHRVWGRVLLLSHLLLAHCAGTRGRGWAPWCGHTWCEVLGRGWSAAGAEVERWCWPWCFGQGCCRTQRESPRDPAPDSVRPSSGCLAV